MVFKGNSLKVSVCGQTTQLCQRITNCSVRQILESADKINEGISLSGISNECRHTIRLPDEVTLVYGFVRNKRTLPKYSIVLTPTKCHVLNGVFRTSAVMYVRVMQCH